MRNDRLAGAIVIGDGAHRAVAAPGVCANRRSLADNRAELLFPSVEPTRPPPVPRPSRTRRRSATATPSSKAQIIERCSPARAACRPSARRRAPGPAAGRAGRRSRRSSSSRAAALADPEVLAAPASHAEVRLWRRPACRRRRRHAQQDRAHQEREGRPRHRRRRATPRAGRLAGDRRRRPRAAEVGRRVLPPSDARAVHDAPAHVERPDQRRTDAHDRRDHRASSARRSSTSRRGSRFSFAGSRSSNVPEIWDRLERVGLASLQTGMDNIRNVIGCPVAGLTPHELFDASPIVREFTDTFLRNKAFTNLPRKFNVGISGCTEHCTHAESQDLALTPAVKTIDGREVKGFNVVVGGKMGSGGCRIATPLDVFVRPEEAAALCGHDHVDLPRSRFAGVAHESAPRVSDRGMGRREVSRRSWSAASGGRCARPAGTARIATRRSPRRRETEAGGAQLRRPGRSGRPHHCRTAVRAGAPRRRATATARSG